MKLPRLVPALLVLFTIQARVELAAEILPPEKDELTATTKWFDDLREPDLRGKPYVELMFGSARVGAKTVDGQKVRGFLLAEDADTFTLFSDGTFSPRSPLGSSVGWPVVVAHYGKTSPGWNGPERVTKRVLKLEEAVNEALRPPDPDEEPWSRFSRKISDYTATFVLARYCARQGRSDLAAKLDARVRQLLAQRTQHTQTVISLRASLESEIANVRMWKAVVDCGDLKVSRPKLLDEFQGVVRDFPASEHRERAAGFVEILQKMVAEDRAHSRAAALRPTASPEQQVPELIFRLRDQNGHQFSQPGSCDIFEDFGGASKGSPSPARQLVALGPAAVPALIKALDDPRLTRSVGCWRDFVFSHYVLTVGDCAEMILSRIAARRLWTPHTANTMQEDHQAAETRAAAEQWWQDWQTKGEKEMLIETVRKGGGDSISAARRLGEMDGSAALAAVNVALKAEPSPYTQQNLIEVIDRIKTDEATDFLRQQMTLNGSLGGRVTAARGLLRRGGPEAIPAMILEWKRAKLGEPAEGMEALISFLANRDDLAALRALTERFSDLALAMKFKVIEELCASTDFFEPMIGKKAPRRAEVDQAAENLVESALRQEDAWVGRSGRWNNASYVNPRLCDFAAYALVQRWPQRYAFHWSTTQIERDPQIVQARNVWRAAHGLNALPLPTIPENARAAREPNVVSHLTWKGGPPLARVAMEEGKVATAEDLVATLIALHRDLPKDLVGFDFVAERAADRSGFIVQIAWASAKSNPGGVWIKGGGWSYQVSVLRGEERLYNSFGGGSRENQTSLSGYEALLRAFKKALSNEARTSVSISFSSRLVAE